MQQLTTTCVSQHHQRTPTRQPTTIVKEGERVAARRRRHGGERARVGRRRRRLGEVERHAQLCCRAVERDEQSQIEFSACAAATDYTYRRGDLIPTNRSCHRVTAR
jgi:hypothetical protein